MAHRDKVRTATVQVSSNLKGKGNEKGFGKILKIQEREGEVNY